MMLGQGSFELVRVPTQPGLVGWLCWLHNLGPGASPVKLPGPVREAGLPNGPCRQQPWEGRGEEGWLLLDGLHKCWGAGPLGKPTSF